MHCECIALLAEWIAVVAVDLDFIRVGGAVLRCLAGEELCFSFGQWLGFEIEGQDEGGLVFEEG